MTTTQVRFEWKLGGNQVEVTGSFVDWGARIPLSRDPLHNDVWSAVVPLTPGTYEYKFIIDGSQWCYDFEKEYKSDGIGNTNNVVRVPPSASSTIGVLGHSADQSDLIAQLRQQISEATKERDNIKQQLAPPSALEAAFRTWGLRQRTPVSYILNRSDQGEGLVGSTMGVAGWIKTLRLQSKDTIAFIKLNDGSTFTDLQVTVDHDVVGFEHIMSHQACVSASVFALGTLVSSKGKEQRVELQTSELRLLGSSKAEQYPIPRGAQLKLENLRLYGHLRPRSQLIAAITKVRNSLAWATHLYFQGQGFLYINSPLITAADCEGAGELFQVTTLLKQCQDQPKSLPVFSSGGEGEVGKIDYNKDFFKKKTYLTVSGQLNAEVYACAMGSVYTFGPTFRAEYSNTARHLAEFWMIEPEIAFADIVENMNVAEQYVKYTLTYVLKHNQKELEFLEEFEKENMEELKKQHDEGGASSVSDGSGGGGSEQQTETKGKKQKQQQQHTTTQQPKKKLQHQKDIRGFRLQPLSQRLHHVATSDFARITYTEAIDILMKSNEPFEKPVLWGIDLASEHERWLAEVYFQRPVIVRDYPKQIKAFYMRQNPDERTVAAMDVLVPGVGELIGGSQREERAEVLEARMRECGIDPEGYQWYLDLRRYGSVPHSGFGLGFERLVCYATGAENIREAIPFPRYPGHAEY